MLYHFSFEETSKKRTAVLSFGRMNPPTVGHQKLMKKLVDVSKKEDGVPILFLSHSQDTNKNPLTYEEKLKFVCSNTPKGLRVMETPAKTVYEVIDVLVKQGYKDIIFVCGSDRVKQFSQLEKYIEQFGLYSFKVISSGERDADSDDIEISVSASKMREYAKNEDFENFANGSGCSKSLIRDMYTATRKGMNL